MAIAIALITVWLLTVAANTVTILPSEQVSFTVPARGISYSH